MITITATVPCMEPPAWAIMERQLIALMNESVVYFLNKYLREDGTLPWLDVWHDMWHHRDGIDDFYEPYFNWPLLYALGGADDLLPLSKRQWEAVTRQLTALGVLHKEYEPGYDNFHQSESLMFFYYLCVADPNDARLRELVQRFAGFYLNEGLDGEPIYDDDKKIIRAPHVGSTGPRWGYSNHAEPSYGWSAGMRRYGLPLMGIEDINTYDDLKDPALARRMGQAIEERMGKGDVAINLSVTSLMAMAYMMTGAEKYRQWTLEYIEAWQARADANDGLIPDNVGLSGEVGEYLDGRWYGGLYGWLWPHGFYAIGSAALVASTSAYLLTADRQYLRLARQLIDNIHDRGELRPVDRDMSLGGHFVGPFVAQFGSEDVPEDSDDKLFLVPYRYSDAGWFDYQPLLAAFPVVLWHATQAEADRARVEKLRQQSTYDWRAVVSFRDKGDTSHEEPWVCFLNGENDDYPVQILAASMGQVYRRLEQIREDSPDLEGRHIHHLQRVNPVTTEALVQLTLGGPHPLYNGGLLLTRVRYFDADAGRPGLPPDVAALVRRVEPDGVTVELVNLSAFETRRCEVQAGAFGEHQIQTVSYAARTSEYPGEIGSYRAPTLTTAVETVAVNGDRFRVELPPATCITLTLVLDMYANTPTLGREDAGQ